MKSIRFNITEKVGQNIRNALLDEIWRNIELDSVQKNICTIIRSGIGDEIWDCLGKRSFVANIHESIKINLKKWKTSRTKSEEK